MFILQGNGWCPASGAAAASEYDTGSAHGLTWNKFNASLHQWYTQSIFDNIRVGKIAVQNFQTGQLLKITRNQSVFHY